MAMPRPPTLVERVNRWVAMALGTARSDDRDEVGRLGEQVAEQELKRLGWEIISRNVRVPMGEADVLARDPQGVYVVVEVKTRVREQGGSSASQTMSPFASVTARKRAKLRAIARYLAEQNGWPMSRVRVDAVAVEFAREAKGALKAMDVRVARGVA